MQNQTVQPPPGAGAPGESGQRPGDSRAGVRPVFVDPSGRRQRRVRRLGRLLAIPAAAYVALVLSTALGGPSVDSPYLPVPAAGDHHSAGPSSGRTGGGDSTPEARKTSGPTAGSHTVQPGRRGGTAGVPASPTAAGTASPSASQPATASASPAPSAVPTATHGKSQVTHPVPTHTGRGHG